MNILGTTNSVYQYANRDKAKPEIFRKFLNNTNKQTKNKSIFSLQGSVIIGRYQRTLEWGGEHISVFLYLSLAVAEVSPDILV